MGTHKIGFCLRGLPFGIITGGGQLSVTQFELGISFKFTCKHVSLLLFVYFAAWAGKLFRALFFFSYQKYWVQIEFAFLAER